MKKPLELSPDIREQLDKWLLRYPPEQRRSGVLEALRLVQEHHGYLTEELMEAVAVYLDMPPVAVFGVATFYSLYHLHPVGRHVIDVCTNVSCELNGANDMLNHFKDRLGVGINETTADGKFMLREVECLGACVAPPVCQIGKKYYENLSPEKIDDMLKKLSEA